MKTTNKKNILYLSYDGLLEPLGHSQILSYLELLLSIKKDVSTFEKLADVYRREKKWKNKKN